MAVVDAFLWHEDLECNSIQFDKRSWSYGRRDVPLFRAARRLNVIQFKLIKRTEAPAAATVSSSEPSAILKMQRSLSRNLPPKLLFCFHSLISF